MTSTAFSLDGLHAARLPPGRASPGARRRGVPRPAGRRRRRPSCRSFGGCRTTGWRRRQPGRKASRSASSTRRTSAVSRGGHRARGRISWRSPTSGRGPRVELSMDLMRFIDASAKDVMEALLTHLMLWGARRDISDSPGMAPLSGFENSPVASLWQRRGSVPLRTRRGGLRVPGPSGLQREVQSHLGTAFLAYRGALSLPRILADVSALIAGGYRRIFLKRAADTEMPPRILTASSSAHQPPVKRRDVQCS